MTILLSVQAALYTALSKDNTLKAKITGVYDAVPEDTKLPYVVIGEGREEEGDLIGVENYAVQVNVHVYTDSSLGYTSSLGILAEVERILNGGLTISGYTVGPIFVESASTESPDAFTRHVPLTARFSVYK